MVEFKKENFDHKCVYRVFQWTGDGFKEAFFTEKEDAQEYQRKDPKHRNLNIWSWEMYIEAMQ